MHNGGDFRRIILVCDFAHDFFEDVFDGDQAGHTAEFVDKQGDVESFPLHFVE